MKMQLPVALAIGQLRARTSEMVDLLYWPLPPPFTGQISVKNRKTQQKPVTETPSYLHPSQGTIIGAPQLRVQLLDRERAWYHLYTRTPLCLCGHSELKCNYIHWKKLISHGWVFGQIESIRLSHNLILTILTQSWPKLGTISFDLKSIMNG